MTEADELRTAANRLRALADAAHGNTWGVARDRDDHPQGDGALTAIGIEPTDGVHDCDLIFQAPEIADEDAEYIAAMDPSVGIALATWLGWMADAVDYASVAIIASALTIARKINTKEH